ncbi:MAG: ribosomal protein S18-alanine N-acetyltransferase [Chloroflexi bacterium]|nr:ribosomal protein S18-alanine N-acetyltransferase [Chloroflexota bacterium]
MSANNLGAWAGGWVTAVYLDFMRLEDLDQVAEIEREAFSMPWPSSAYRRELRTNKNAFYIVARLGTPRNEKLSPSYALLRRPFPFSLIPHPPSVEHYLSQRDLIVGHTGLWRLADQAHITTIAVRQSYRRHGVGELLLTGIFDITYNIGSEAVTLEVRKSNTGAQRLYIKYGFHQVGIRPRYYSDNNEDAIIMWTDALNSESMRTLLAQRRTELAAKLGIPEIPEWLPGARASTEERR